MHGWLGKVTGEIEKSRRADDESGVERASKKSMSYEEKVYIIGASTAAAS